MSCVAIAMGWCLLAQARDNPRRYEPQIVPKAAPAASIEDPPARTRSARGDEALGVPEADADSARQQPATPFDETPRTRRRDDSEADTAAGGAHQKTRPPEILAGALARPAEAALSGKPVSLLAAISRTPDRQQQLRIARAYWRLSTAQAEYHWALDQREKLKHFTQSHTNSTETLSARASARADVRDAELAATQAQQELVDLLGGTASDSPPLAVDRPHVGGYNTYYEEIFANRAPPARIRLIHRMLPIRRKAIDAHGEAILAASDALEATGEEFTRTGQGLMTTLTALDQLKHERKLFMAAVRDYNLEIAEYLFAVLPPGTSDKTLVSKLILNTERAAQSPESQRSDDRTFAPADGEAPRDPDTQGAESSSSARNRTTEFRRAEPSADAALYAGLADLGDGARVEKLAGLLHWERALPTDAGQPTPLADCLRGVAPTARRALVAAYWQARECAARYQTLSEQADQLGALSSIAVHAREAQGMAEAGVRLQAIRRAVRAALLDAEASLVDAEFTLTQTAGRPLDARWLLPDSIPQSHHSQPANVPAQDGPQRAEVIDVQYAKLEDLADAVIQADAGRAAIAGESQQAPSSETPQRLDHAVWAIATQTHDTLSFLSGLTEYNLSVAERALAMSPADVSAEELAGKLSGVGGSHNEL
jgi:hypothetical protein